MNLVKILEGKEGTSLYSSLYGELTLFNINETDKFPIACYVVGTGEKVYFTKEGLYFREYKDAECVLFPSKSNRNWEKFRYDLPKGTPVMVHSNTESSWMFRYYAGDSYAYYKQESPCRDKSQWKYTIPVDKFNFKDRTFNTEDNYGTANR